MQGVDHDILPSFSALFLILVELLSSVQQLLYVPFSLSLSGQASIAYAASSIRMDKNNELETESEHQAEQV